MIPSNFPAVLILQSAVLLPQKKVSHGNPEVNHPSEDSWTQRCGKNWYLLHIGGTYFLMILPYHLNSGKILKFTLVNSPSSLEVPHLSKHRNPLKIHQIGPKPESCSVDPIGLREHVFMLPQNNSRHHLENQWRHDNKHLRLIRHLKNQKTHTQYFFLKK